MDRLIRVALTGFLFAACDVSESVSISNTQKIGDLTDDQITDLCNVVDLNPCEDTGPNFARSASDCQAVFETMRSFEANRLAKPFVDCWTQSSCGPLFECWNSCRDYPIEACNVTGCQIEFARKYDGESLCYAASLPVFCNNLLVNCTSSFPNYVVSPSGVRYLMDRNCGVATDWIVEAQSDGTGVELCDDPQECQFLGREDCDKREDCRAIFLRDYYPSVECLSELTFGGCGTSIDVCFDNPAIVVTDNVEYCAVVPNGCQPRGLRAPLVAQCEGVISTPICF